MKKAANPDDLLNTEIKIVDEVTLSFVARVHRFQRYISWFEVWNCTMSALPFDRVSLGLR